MAETTVSHDEPLGAGGAALGRVPALVIAWSQEEPWRIGEAAFPGGDERVLGRGAAPAGAGAIVFVRQRPGKEAEAPPIQGRGISREQLRVRAAGDAIDVERVGRCPLLVNGRPADRARVRAGDTVLLKSQLLLLCTLRPRRLPPLRHPWGAPLHAFGEPDAAGLVGEGPAAWDLRDRIAFHARAGAHLLIHGESGTGKELVARAVHRLSGRGPFVARNAATFPPGLVDAELFGNVRNYPHAGMPERPGLVGQADGGTLFLDEIGELPHDLSAHLLRLLDEGGEYHRLGEAAARRARIHLVAATNRDPAALKHDLLARLTLRLDLPPLAGRREDVPLLARHIVRRIADRSPEIARPFLDDRGEPRIHSLLAERLLRHPYAANARELDRLIWTAVATSPGDLLQITGEVEAALAAAGPAPSPAAAPDAGGPRPARAEEPHADAVRAALRDHDGKLTHAAKALGMSRWALRRLLEKNGDAFDPTE